MTAPTSVPRAEFTDLVLPETPRSLVLVLHGGSGRSSKPVDGTSLSWRRARALLHAVSPPLLDHGVGLALLRFQVKGWNGPTDPSPVADARWALDTIATRYGLPVTILGHSMGGRTAVAVADHPSVLGVVGLAPWLPPNEPFAPLRAKTLRVAHGSGDRITSARATRRFVSQAQQAGIDAEFTDMGGVGHYMLRRVAEWNSFATRTCLEVAAEGSD